MSYSDECGKSGILKTLLITVRMQYGRTWGGLERGVGGREGDRL